MFGSHLNQTGAMPPERSNSTDRARRAKAATQETNRVQILNPLTVGYVGLPSRNILYVVRIHQVNFKPARLQDLVHRDPVNACGFHRNRSDSTTLKPIG